MNVDFYILYLMWKMFFREAIKGLHNALIEISIGDAFHYIWGSNQKSAYFPNICAPKYGRFCSLVFAKQTITFGRNERILI